MICYRGFYLVSLKQNIVHINDHDRSAGYLEFEKARSEMVFINKL